MRLEKNKDNTTKGTKVAINNSRDSFSLKLRRNRGGK
jgi:hypothetical protein